MPAAATPVLRGTSENPTGFARLTFRALLAQCLALCADAVRAAGLPTMPGSRQLGEFRTWLSARAVAGSQDCGRTGDSRPQVDLQWSSRGWHGKLTGAAKLNDGRPNRSALSDRVSRHVGHLAHQGFAAKNREAIDNYERKNEAEHAKFSEALAEQGNELTALGVEVAELIVPAEREILESLRQLAARSGAQERKSPDDD